LFAVCFTYDTCITNLSEATLQLVGVLFLVNSDECCCRSRSSFSKRHLNLEAIYARWHMPLLVKLIVRCTLRSLSTHHAANRFE
jgi:hypothetical protein